MTITILPDTSGSLLHVQASDKLTREDYAQWVPALDQQIERHGRVSILFEMRAFHGWTAGALWADLKFGVQHFTKIRRIAIVGEAAWQKGMAMFCKPFTMARVRYFAADNISAAQEWLSDEAHGARPKAPVDYRTMPQPVAELIRSLDSEDGIARGKVRAELTAMGSGITEHLAAAAQGGSRQLRLEATRALADIADPTTASVLTARFDDDLEIGWAAAEGVKQLGQVGAIAALKELLGNPNSHGVRMSAHHALRHMEANEVRATVAPVTESLINEDPIAAISVAADAALRALGSE